ncbi:MAG: bifunctional adenosylcobinamide kinase/adenosylcobinamide-phosphate guanylyltransferase [Lachnospiraceae bacterium]|nr:bifunctional adenosylcobinamide kinase/adenosylcobinamide-phosphate guanylyltransferase [Lachnospiraceae bacterium]MDD3615958.1 bifunctional adenosylcobinamide kinase/adenosylcobinamide-phosphate guanylyltransferase [Lachnospiraceae bacterium]
MVMYIGGAFQGQDTLAKEEYPHIHWVDGECCSWDELMEAEGVLNFHEFIKEQLRQEKDLSSLAEEMLKKNSGLIIVSNEVGYGVVPVDAFERKYRECVGRVCTKLAAGSDKVCRVVCGIGAWIKDA